MEAPAPAASPRAASPSGSDEGARRREEADAVCPLCRAQFTTTFRRHHCRHCGTLVCDDCSKQRIRLPGQSSGGKVRVCNPCASSISQSQASGFEEDLAVNSEIIDHLRGALSQRYAESEASKRVLLELEAEATRDPLLLEQYARDPESDAHSFAVLQQRVQERWAALHSSLEQQARLQAELQERRRQLAQRRDEAAAQQRGLSERRAAVDAELAEMARAEARRDELARGEAGLGEAVAAARRRVRELELERREHEERRERQQRRWRTGRIELRSAEAAGAPGAAAQAFTISTGRRDPLLAGGGRLEGCRRSCALM